jgi:alpha-D-xyloside xylohydrolase
LAHISEDMIGLVQQLQDQYIEINSPIPASATLFGAGEHISATGLPLRRDGVPLTLWTRDCAAADPDQNTYGSWPFLIDVRQGGLSPGKLGSVDIRLYS